MTTATTIQPVDFEPPLQNPSPFGLFPATTWNPPTDPGDSPEGSAVRHLLGVNIRPVGNYGGEGQFGTWEGGWCRGAIVTVVVTATGGKWKYTYAGQTTAAVNHNVSAADLKTAITNLSNVEADDVVVVSPTAGTYVISHRDRGAVSAASDTGTPLTGTGAGVTVDPETKSGVRALGLPPFDPVVVWAYDECDLTAPSRREVEERAAQVLRLEEQVAVERSLAGRMLADAGTPAEAASLKLAVGYLEAQLALTSTIGYLHVGAQWVAQEFGLFVKAGTTFKSPLGHTWVIGGGYVDGLENVIVATSPTYGWRDEPTVREAIDERNNTYLAIAERTVVVGYEELIAAVEISA